MDFFRARIELNDDNFFHQTTRGSAVLVGFAWQIFLGKSVLIVASMVAYLVVLMRFASRTPERKQFLSPRVAYGMWVLMWNDDWHAEVNPTAVSQPQCTASALRW